MKRWIAMLTLAAACANGQTAKNRVAVDVANSAVSYRDFVADGDYTNSLRLWLPFLVAPTGATYDAGDCARFRSAITQPGASSRPAWTNGGMRFDGTNDWLIAPFPASTTGTVIARFAAISNSGTFYANPYAIGNTNQTTNFLSFQAATDPSVGWTNTFRINLQGSYNVGTSNNTAGSTQTQIVAFVQDGISAKIYVGGIDQPLLTNSGVNSARWWHTLTGTNQLTGAVGRTPTSAGGGAYNPMQIQWVQVYSRALSSAEVYRVSTQGPTR